MKVLIVFAHPDPHSFSAALKDRAVEELTAAGHEVAVSDLYRMGWNAGLEPEDLRVRRDDDELPKLSAVQKQADAHEGTSSTLLAEQDKVAEADLVLFHFPLWWFSMPAILKGWVDRVFSYGFAYSVGRKYSRGHFRGKRAMLCVTTGTASTLYDSHGMDGDLLHVLWPIHNGTLAYTGFTVLPPFAAWMPGKVTAEERTVYLNDYGQVLRNLDSAAPLFFHPMEDYNEDQQLREGVEARSGVQWNPSAGQTFESAAHKFTRR